ncbi:cytochrome P450 4C1 isoform X1 [Solenopsis invicta]|uniref:cytochrome P450 4C1 isoform X1 n=2 Tax=Solenopsis invicta TaxID=13686 RepID=UPI00193D7EF3|nr:cytochrome P450 4C1 isoform X1 [Solenopsis invicta]XP_039309281.1 cytochrome P450 4C1 isoform X1 [Solenopsis invicta]
MTEKAKLLTECLQRKMDENPGNAVNIFPFLMNAALDIICETAMGMDLHVQGRVQSPHITAIQKIAKLTTIRMFQPWLWIDWLYYLTPAGRQYKSTLKIVHEFADEVIKKKKLEQHSKTDLIKLKNKDNDIGKKKKTTFLDVLLEENAKNDTPMSDNELRAHVDTIMSAGHGTTAVAVCWTLFLLGNNPDHQEKVHEELEEVFRDSETPATKEQLNDLKYLSRVIDETLRIFPSAPTISRKLMKEVKLDDHIILPKDHEVVVPIVLVHRNPEVWPDPLKFDPDRFLPENKNKKQYAYIPFSSGPRSCIGKKFALIELKILVVAILRKWKVESEKTMDTIKYGEIIVLVPCEKLLIHFVPKKRYQFASK